MKTYITLLKQVLFFVAVGILTLAIDVGVSTALYSFLHFPAFLASAFGFLSGFFFGFPVNKKKVFHHTKDDRYNLKKQVSFYWILLVFNLIVTSLLVELLVSLSIIEIQYAKVLVTVLIASWNFIIYKIFIFSKTKPDQDADLK